MIYSVYQITNITNGKKYIGYTQLTPQQRWVRHQREFNYGDSKWHRALKKYRPESFEVTVLLETEDKNEALRSERRFIKELNTIAEGYNTHEGGRGGNTGAYHKVGRKGPLNPMFGRAHTDQEKRDISERSKLMWKNKTEEQRQMIAENTRRIHTGRKWKNSQVKNLRISLKDRIRLPTVIYSMISPNGEVTKLLGSKALKIFARDNDLCLWIIERRLLKNKEPKRGSCVGWKCTAIQNPYHCIERV
jgi:group I intron endonuclease